MLKSSSFYITKDKLYAQEGVNHEEVDSELSADESEEEEVLEDNQFFYFDCPWCKAIFYDKTKLVTHISACKDKL